MQKTSFDRTKAAALQVALAGVRAAVAFPFLSLSTVRGIRGRLTPALEVIPVRRIHGSVNGIEYSRLDKGVAGHPFEVNETGETCD